MSIDWDEITAEATDLLVRYLQLDTSNPPGNESIAVDFLEGVLGEAGIAIERADSTPGRSNLYARMGPAGGVTLLNHTDVVPVERQFWSREPFSGEPGSGGETGRPGADHDHIPGAL